MKPIRVMPFFAACFVFLVFAGQQDRLSADAPRSVNFAISLSVVVGIMLVGLLMYRFGIWLEKAPVTKKGKNNVVVSK